MNTSMRCLPTPQRLEKNDFFKLSTFCATQVSRVCIGSDFLDRE